MQSFDFNNVFYNNQNPSVLFVLFSHANKRYWDLKGKM